MYELLYFLQLALTVYALYHAFRHGAPWWWFLLIFFFQPLGAIIYLVVEVLPGMRAQNNQVRMASAHRSEPTKSDVKSLRRQAEETPTPRNYALLADALARNGEPEEAVRLYREECLHGHNATDAELLEGLVRAQLAAKDGPGALDTLDRIPDQGISAEKQERQLLRGRALMLAERNEEALALLEQLVTVYPGEEARVCLGETQAKLGQSEKARETFQEVIRNVRRLKGNWRQRQVTFLRRAQRGLKSL
ncbi:MAG: tetratricopeptide repeat protein [Verrucomicrobiota bacterium JB022]|nr:tetratricopeptide repeat protein [Verrucomicrobiota bacterium JB022]